MTKVLPLIKPLTLQSLPGLFSCSLTLMGLLRLSTTASFACLRLRSTPSFDCTPSIHPPLTCEIYCIELGPGKLQSCSGAIELAFNFLRLIRKYIFRPKESPDAGEQMAERLRELSRPDSDDSASTPQPDEKPRPKAS